MCSSEGGGRSAPSGRRARRCSTKGVEPSSGMRALAIMLHVCKTVDLYGFRGVVGYRSWYWEKYHGFQVRVFTQRPDAFRLRRPLRLSGAPRLAQPCVC